MSYATMFVYLFFALLFLHAVWRVFGAWKRPELVVIGDSMLPTYHPLEKLRTKRVFRWNELVLNNVYVFEAPYSKDYYSKETGRVHQDHCLLIKRLIGFDDQGYCYFVGDNRDASYDSRQFGLIHRDKIIAVIEGRIANEGD